MTGESVQVPPNFHFWSDLEFFSVFVQSAGQICIKKINVTAFAVTREQKLPSKVLNSTLDRIGQPKIKNQMW